MVKRRVATAKNRGGVPQEPAADENKEETQVGSAGTALLEPKVRYSSKVPFFPPSNKYWRIGTKWYNFTSFLHRHPGGSEALLLSRDRFEDCTNVFEANHLDYKRVRKIIQKYEVDEAIVRRDGLRRRPGRHDRGVKGVHHDKQLDEDETPQLLEDDAFYSVMRSRVHEYLKSVGHPDGGPTMQCIIMFWASFVLWLGCYTWLLCSGTIIAAVCTGFSASWLGAFGHNWVHQPRYKFWAYLSLDTIGFSSDAWFREHNLQHHMYTNTPWDNHHEGTAPFLITDPTVERNAIQRYILPYINPVILSVGLYGNYIAHTVELMKGNEVATLWKLLLPMEIAALGYRWGIKGFALMYLSHAILGVYYFTMALMNHNAEHCVDVQKRNASRDWGEAQLRVSADWNIGMPFWASFVYLWLNYHTVHHMFPRVDMSHHGGIQKIMMETCAEFGVDYNVASPWQIYSDMIRTFSSPSSLMQEIMVYGGNL